MIRVIAANSLTPFQGSIPGRDDLRLLPELEQRPVYSSRVILKAMKDIVQAYGAEEMTG